MRHIPDSVGGKFVALSQGNPVQITPHTLFAGLTHWEGEITAEDGKLVGR